MIFKEGAQPDPGPVLILSGSSCSHIRSLRSVVQSLLLTALSIFATMNTEQQSIWQQPLSDTQPGSDINTDSVVPAIDPPLLPLQYYPTGVGNVLPWPVGQPTYIDGFYDGFNSYLDLQLRLANSESQIAAMGTQISCLEANMQKL